MSVQKLAWALEQPIKPATAKLVLIALANNCPSQGLAFPSVECLCYQTSLDRKTVIKALGNLEASGLISDTGKRVGATKQIKAFKLNNPMTGIICIKSGKSPVFPMKGSRFSLRRVPKTGHVPLREHEDGT